MVERNRAFGETLDASYPNTQEVYAAASREE
jgi:hypothetical protein